MWFFCEVHIAARVLVLVVVILVAAAVIEKIEFLHFGP
jgi:hypothetical protein